ncbi:hypothetical protein [Cyclobacterium qasimii]|uniref:Uncharacterized protein n=2 Tax=Cyclobacterium qasimii TaxID=1350429 RepID=S7VEH5_9BACT|nr:hypothetical protein [Cyclobacterium qasimii]EPR68431.1 hypothetical protein ADICYQ_2526 [Cyclobacterium qasimii M12-11B]GEO23760.1 hypothetical protein CQA01_42940 [Cyclobacterium qasimii]
MSETQYQLVFKIDVNHSYFNGNQKAPLTIIPSQSSGQSISRLNFIVKKRNGGLDLFVASPFPLADYLKTIVHKTGIEFFDFDLISEDTYFTSYTAFPVDGLGLFQYSSDDELNKIENGIIVLHPVYQGAQTGPALGRIRVCLDDLIPPLEAGRSVHFNINFNSRSIQWQYNFLNNGGLPLTGISIVSDSGVQFSGPTEVVLKNGHSAMRFDSNVLIPLRQNPEYSFDLLKGGKIILKGLPSPSPSGLFKIETDTEAIMGAAMYVYV